MEHQMLQERNYSNIFIQQKGLVKSWNKMTLMIGVNLPSHWEAVPYKHSPAFLLLEDSLVKSCLYIAEGTQW